ncbi:MAG: glycosyltransferase family 39 protein [Anaerolineaceae bacterium]|nr:glycosyltransferase family 39 protein [Anaerolineaceae bacterium]
MKIFLVLALLLAFHLRMDAVGDWPLRWDEAFSVWFGQMGLVEGTIKTADDIHPPLYFWLLHVWLRLAGISEFAIRALSVFLGLLTIAVVHSLTLHLSRRKLAAALAVLLITLSPFHIAWSQDARMYPLVTMFAGLVLYAYIKDTLRKWGGWTALLAISGAAAALSHPFGVFVLAILALHRALHWRDFRGSNRRWIMANLVTGIALLPWLAFSIGTIRTDPGPATFEPLFAYQLMATLFATGVSVHIDDWILPVLLISSVFILGLALNWRRHRRATSLILLGCALHPLLITSLGLPFVPFYISDLQERHFIVFAPFVFAGLGISLAAMLRHPWLRLPGALALVGLLTLSSVRTLEKSDLRYFRDDYRSMMAAVTALTTADDKIFFVSGGRKPVVYYHLDRVGYDGPKDSWAEPPNVTGIPGYADDLPAMMARIFATFPRFWLIEIEAHLDDPPGARINWIDEHYHRIHHIPVAHNGISYYSRDENEALPDVRTLVPPVIREARPGDQVRIGVPAGATVDLVHAGVTMESRRADSWQLLSFDIYPHYPNGEYALRVAEDSYSFIVTHSQASS